MFFGGLAAGSPVAPPAPPPGGSETRAKAALTICMISYFGGFAGNENRAIISTCPPTAYLPGNTSDSTYQYLHYLLGNAEVL